MDIRSSPIERPYPATILVRIRSGDIRNDPDEIQIAWNRWAIEKLLARENVPGIKPILVASEKRP